MDHKEAIVKEMDALPEEKLREVLDFVQFLKNKTSRDMNTYEVSMVSESSLSRDWDKEEEDEAWSHL